MFYLVYSFEVLNDKTELSSVDIGRPSTPWEFLLVEIEELLEVAVLAEHLEGVELHLDVASAVDAGREEAQGCQNDCRLHSFESGLNIFY